jgi:uncharacterized protein (DUF2267 family)
MAVRVEDEILQDSERYERFIVTIQQQAWISWERAERAAEATLRTLAERISRGTAQRLAEQLPVPVRRWLRDAPEHPEAFRVEEFVRRVAQREGVGVVTASRHARAVFVALARLVPGDELDQLVAELPHEYEPFLGDVAARLRAGPAPEAVTADGFLERLASRTGLDPDQAQRAAEAVLETLAERVAGGEVDDLAAALPDRLRPALERGKAATGGKARRMPLDEFVARVAQREGLDREDALDHARAVFATLREALPPKELSDLLAQLPRGYAEALLG